MTEKKAKSLLPSLETGIIIIFFFGFIIWAVSKCRATRAAYQEQQVQKLQETEDTVAIAAELALDKVIRVDTLPTQVQQPQNLTSLYVTVDSLNMREEPRLNSSIITKLRIDERVLFMNEVTDHRLEIKFGDILTNEPWVKIQNQQGRVGWVYGAGVHFYKKQLPKPVE